MGRKLSYLEEAYQYQQELWRRAMWARASRQLVIRAGTLASLGGVSAISGLLAACAGGAERAIVEQAERGSYRYSRYPLVEKYNWRNLNWSDTPYIGGTELAQGTFNNFDLMRGPDIPPAGYFGNSLMHINMFGPKNLVQPEANFEKSEMALDMAESMEHDPTFTVWTFRIHRGVRFHNIPPVNGRECTAEDVVFSYQRYKDTSLFPTGLDAVEKVEALDRYTVRFTLKQPQVFFPYNVGLPNYLVFAREHFEGPEEQWQQQPILTGPFVMTFNRFRDRLDAVRHPEYFRFDRRGNRLPYNDQFKRVYIADEAAQVAAFRTGQIDYMSPGTVDLLEDLLNTNPNILVHVQPFWGTFQIYFVFQHKNPVWQDVRMRRALSMALDRRKVIDVVYRGAALFSRPVSYDFLGLDEPQRDEDLGPYMQYNPGEARRLLEEAGFRDGIDVELTTTSPPSDLYVLFQQMWAEVGIRLRFDLQESSVVNAKRNQKTFRDLIPNGNISAYELDAWARRQFLPESPQNWGSINDPVLNELIRKQHLSTDPDERIRIAHQISERELDQLNIFWHVSGHVMMVRHPWIWNFSNHLHSSVDSRGKSVHQVMWLDERAPAGRAGRRTG